jgi:hypothetical protein
MDEHRNGKARRRGLLAAVLSAAAVAVALPVTGALADGGSGGSSAAGSVPVQTQDQPVPRDDSSPRDDRDCPEKDGARGSSSDAPVEL